MENNRSMFVSFSVNSNSGYPAASSQRLPYCQCCNSAHTLPGTLVAAHITGRRKSLPHDHVLRNQIDGKIFSDAYSGPRLIAVILMRMSSTSAFAYSTNTSK